ncbi:MAG TPA: DUF6112 family protein [Acidimicrobiales bacterium]|nr:DUF6112 family protein [Acidimicrobiales bacterium]
MPYSGVLYLASDPVYRPTPNIGALPGGHLLQVLADGISGWALMLAILGLLVGAATWAIGSHSQNYQHSTAGRRAVVVSGLAALLIGAAPAIVSFFFAAGHDVPNNCGSATATAAATPTTEHLC